ncbi:phage Gp37/Gp68 family protein [Streptomyces sp. MNU76]|uniref:DUF5131 family protein n=1 Tax=Streptomyces sp. MNU76 TaxID=2560026 RepID=UPI001E5DF32F|nr:phage Gp37/Gp68 family protein [Streptomyces sp. MNU76]MCC9708234.1 phage Gp37/Gp68 family protein [Streptomyces sp. MNU76]
MGDHTAIEWTDRTFNPWWGCSRISPGCRNCYADQLAHRWGHDVFHLGGQRRMLSGANWRKPLKWNREAQEAGTPLRVFTASMGDVFEDHPQVTTARERLWELIDQTPWLRWQLLTKRPENVSAMVPWKDAWPDHVWIGTSCEDQRRADERIPLLLQINARVRFLSCEPLLGPIDLGRWLPAQQLHSLTSLVSLDDEVGDEGSEQSRDICCTTDRPVPHGFPPVTLDAGVIPSHSASDGGLQPRDHLGRGAVNAHASTVAMGGLLPPVQVPLAIENASDVPQNTWIRGDFDAEGSSLAASPADGNSALLETPPYRCAAGSEPVGELVDGLAGGVRGGYFRNGDRRTRHGGHSPTIDWLIAGGESGAKGRPMDPAWARSLRDQCQAADVPYFFKQWGEWVPSGYHVIRSRPVAGSVLVGEPVDDLGHRIEMIRVGKKRAGRLLDGHLHDAVPPLTIARSAR